MHESNIVFAGRLALRPPCYRIEGRSGRQKTFKEEECRGSIWLHDMFCFSATFCYCKFAGMARWGAKSRDPNTSPVARLGSPPPLTAAWETLSGTRPDVNLRPWPRLSLPLSQSLYIYTHIYIYIHMSHGIPKTRATPRCDGYITRGA